MNEINCDILWADYVNIVNKICNKSVLIDGELFINFENNYISKERGITLLNIVKSEKSDYSYKEKIFSAFSELVNFKNKPEYFEYWKLMSDEHIKKVSKSKFITIGSHGYFHNNLGNISIDKAHAELSNSKIYLENFTDEIMYKNTFNHFTFLLNPHG